MSGLEDLYREIILDHYRNPRNRGELDVPPATLAEGFNPLCGDEIKIFLEIDDPSKADDAVVTEVRIAGQGCSISQSSASMMSAAIKGRTIAEVKDLTRAFKAMMSIHEGELESGLAAEPEDAEPEELKLGDLEALRGVVKFPVRIKCATLGWNTLLQGLEQATTASA